MNETKQLINIKEQYEEPKIDVILFTCVNTNTLSGDEDGGEWDNALFGLWRTNVGPDVEKNDLFENIPVQ